MWLLLLSFAALTLRTHAQAPSQQGYISIDCGSTSNYTDNSTGIYWSTDDPYISTGVNKAVVSNAAPFVNAQQLTTARYFDEQRSKYCYVLPVEKNGTYIIRAVFLSGDLIVLIPAGYGFSLSIDSTIVQSLQLNQSDINSLRSWEFIVASTSNEIDFCILPVVGKAFISSLELRPFESTMYLGVVYESKYLKGIQRVNCGADATAPAVRYPDDPYDRLWTTPGSTYLFPSITTTRKIEIGSDSFDNPPEKVMQSAWSSSGEFWFYWPFQQETTATFYLAVYFAEIENINSTDFRSLDMYIDGDAETNRVYHYFNFTNNAQELYNAKDPLKGGFVNITMKQSDISTLPPILNAAELLAIYDTSTSSTARQDVLALTELRQSFGLLDWTGDPCLPVAWDWLNCTNSDPPEITEVRLSGYNLQGPIPVSLLSLTLLTDLWLDNNNISGTILDFSVLTNLKTLHLENNSLTGPIPESLASLPSLTELFLEGNNLGPVPAALVNKKGLNLQADTGSSGPASSSSGKKSSSGAAIGAAIGGAVVVLLIVGLAVFFWRRRKAPKPLANGVEQPRHSVASHGTVQADRVQRTPPGVAGEAVGGGSQHGHSARAFSLQEVWTATSNFNRQIGEGGFGPVYYGRLSNGSEVAVKVNLATSRQGSTEFLNEVSLLSRVHHRNLVSLVGFCDEGGQQILIYEFMQNGTLRENLYGRNVTKVVDWPTRLEIALNSARGLEYLHNDCNPKIIHRDVKSNNILLNEKLLAKVADFGISKSTPDEENTGGISTVVRGTTGYLDPEYFVTNKLTYKKRCICFWSCSLELICGRAPYDNGLPDALTWNLVEFARNALREGNLQVIVDSSLAGSYNEEAMWKLAELAMFSVEPRSANRPDMRHIVQGVSEAVNLQHGRESTSTMTGFIPGGGQRVPINFTESTYSNSQASLPMLRSTPDNNPRQNTARSFVDPLGPTPGQVARKLLAEGIYSSAAYTVC